ncbi:MULTISPECIES: UDP-glucose dehydrogenase family protein [Pseudomonas]|jgi:UDPglucose 6-dehydrogenase|uniref:UDP-glucose 6-dehydrogenase n=1 Tax=Pseudomonas mandelii TaxID=75612 RepID=A0ABY0VWQ1_9PSED|nr:MULTISPECIES: UDP-glucose/GDP-mannose dehydrogenase family protein [Pseudomonas]MDO8769698.1 UDP-glucose/GDP-mannose dehydrogenase family protein [Burkholderiaceae bacterium]OOL35505.1 UDP-glucose 6-dehydrogenase [Pseudomonas sp. FSL W5-0299]QQN96712.1 UDP-glucose/GDP-mannose dehydrogenase family protein [Pseudomonas sp. SW-3]QZA95723.1 UDP-glucose/GDP-mannose dehydrogenase family protein [Pseudomonas mandelii]TWS09702.1 UDP-glucose/GDP-mannose dehydrogenase family protein [Pseudomonas mand
MNVSVFGIGYVGLVQGAALAEVGHNVLCVDVDADKVQALKDGTLPLYEPGLKSLVHSNYQSGRLQFGTDLASAVHHGDVLLIAVGTPPDEDGSADLKHVLSVAQTIALNMDRHHIIVDKSTVPVGTGDRVRAHIEQVLADTGRCNLTFDVVSNPEFLKEGCAVEDCMRPDRIIIGTDSQHAEEVMRELYEPFNRNREKIIVMDLRSAELTKYAANSMLATKISFMNEMACLAEKLGADIEMVRHGIGSDPRIGYQFIYPGVGYGGSCFPKDVKALIQAAASVDIDARVLKAVESRNHEQKASLYTKIFNHFDGALRGKTFALWGLSFKPNTDDMREAPSRVLMEALWHAGASVQAFDPKAMEEAQRIYGSRDDLTLAGTKEAALKNADALIIVTEWQSFRAPDFDLLGRQLKHPLIFDGRNLFDPQRLSKRGFTYVSVGRQTRSVI